MPFKGTSFLLLYREPFRLIEKSHLADPFPQFPVVIRSCDEDMVHRESSHCFNGRLLAVEAVDDSEGEGTSVSLHTVSCLR